MNIMFLTFHLLSKTLFFLIYLQLILTRQDKKICFSYSLNVNLI